MAATWMLGCSSVQVEIQANSTSKHHSRLIALSETACGAIFPSNFVHNAVISSSAEIAVMPC